MEGSRPLKQSDNALAQKVEETLVLLNPDSGQYFTLNEVGARIWELLDGNRTREDLVQAICAEFDADEEQVAADVDALLADLRTEQLVDEGARAS